MTDSFLSRIPALSEEALREYLRRPLNYRTEAVEAALAELARRGLAVPEEELQRVRRQLAERASQQAQSRGRWSRRLLGTTPPERSRRVRRITAAILVVGLGSALAVRLATAPKPANPLGYEPEDTKKYLRDLELYGGRANVVATQITRWYDGLWQGRQLATTLAWLTLATAGGFWFVARRPPGPGA